MGFGMMAIVPDVADTTRPLDPANREGDRPAAEAFRALRDGTGPWYARGGARLPYATLRGGRCDWLMDIHDGPGRLIQERTRRDLGSTAFSGEALAELAASFEGLPWTEWMEERYPGVDRRLYRELGSFLDICVEHGLAVSFARG